MSCCADLAHAGPIAQEVARSLATAQQRLQPTATASLSIRGMNGQPASHGAAEGGCVHACAAHPPRASGRP